MNTRSKAELEYGFEFDDYFFIQKGMQKSLEFFLIFIAVSVRNEEYIRGAQKVFLRNYRHLSQPVSCWSIRVKNANDQPLEKSINV